MINNVGNFAIFQDFAFMGIVLYIPFLNDIFFTRPIAFPHYMVPSGGVTSRLDGRDTIGDQVTGSRMDLIKGIL